MIAFFITFILIYGVMNYYAFCRINTVTALGKKTTLLFIFMSLAPLLVKGTEHFAENRLAFYIALPSFIWMGMLFLFCIILATFDLISVLNRLAAFFLKSTLLPKLSTVTSYKISIILAILATIYSLYEARHITTEKVVMHYFKQPTVAYKPIRIVQISDLHLGLLMNEGRLEAILKTIEAAKPDILVSTGDFVDGRLSKQESRQQLEKMAAMVKAVPARIGKYAIAGNHEYYAGIDQALSLTKSAGFTILQNETVKIPNGIAISGIDDPASERIGIKMFSSEAELINMLPIAPFHLMLKHRPILNPSSDGKIDLQLSGHTHKGQLIPFYPLTWLEFPIHSGTTKTANGTTVHVSRGTGTWGPPMRFLAPPEITIIDIVP